MIIGQNEIDKRMDTDHLIVGLGSRDCKNPEGVGRDLRLGAVYRIDHRSRPFIRADFSARVQGTRQGSLVRPIAAYDSKKGVSSQPYLTVKPGDFVLVETLELLNTPKDLMPMWYPRSTLQRNGLLLLTTKIDPGYRGRLIAGLKNLGPVPVKLQMGARIANIVFHTIFGRVVAYRGQHQGGRVNAAKEEIQV